MIPAYDFAKIAVGLGGLLITLAVGDDFGIGQLQFQILVASFRVRSFLSRRLSRLIP